MEAPPRGGPMPRRSASCPSADAAGWSPQQGTGHGGARVGLFAGCLVGGGNAGGLGRLPQGGGAAQLDSSPDSGKSVRRRWGRRVVAEELTLSNAPLLDVLKVPAELLRHLAGSGRAGRGRGRGSGPRRRSPPSNFRSSGSRTAAAAGLHAPTVGLEGPRGTVIRSDAARVDVNRSTSSDGGGIAWNGISIM